MTGYTLVNVTSAFITKVSSKIYIGDDIYLATSCYKALFAATRRYIDFYDNLTISEYRVSELSYDVVKGKESKSYR